MTSVPRYHDRAPVTWAYVKRYNQDSSSSSISSVSDFSSSVEDGERNINEKKQAGLATQINICSGSGFPAGASVKSWDFDPDEEKAKKKKKREHEKESAEKAKLGGMGVPAMLRMESAPPSMVQSETPGAMLDDSDRPPRGSATMVCGAPVIHVVLITVLMFSVVALLVFVAILLAKSGSAEPEKAETEVTIKAHPLHEAAKKLRQLLQRH